MLNTIEISELVRLSTPKQTKYAAARVLGVSDQVLYSWYKYGNVMVDETGLKAAERLHLPPEYVLACLQADRNKGKPSFRYWANIAEQLTPPEMRSAG